MSPLAMDGHRNVVFLLVLLLLPLLLLSFLAEGSGHAVRVSSLIPGSSCSSPKYAGRWGSENGTMEIAHAHGPCSPMGDLGMLSGEEILEGDQSRVRWIHRKQRSSAKISGGSREERPQLGNDPVTASSLAPVRRGDSFETLNYVVTIGVGTPKNDFTVVFDTGSDITWIQCQPCVKSCFQQQEPLFDPAKSSTYCNISCTSSYCGDLPSRSCSSGSCIYGVQYGDNSYTAGFYAQDTLTLSSCDVIPEFRFGCGENNKGLFGKTAGLLGLGRGKSSFVSQTAAIYGGVFRYCLPATPSSRGYLKFGSNPSAAANLKFTPLLSSQVFYAVGLVGITVGGHQLPITSTVFTTGGTIVDSGTVISRLPPDGYTALRTEFRKQMAAYKTAEPLSILDTCYDFTGLDTVTIPAIQLLFSGGVTVQLDLTGVLFAASTSQVCLAFAGNVSPTASGIIGNVQQRKLTVVYDTEHQLVGFGPGDC